MANDFTASWVNPSVSQHSHGSKHLELDMSPL